MSVADIRVTWYADGKRAAVTDERGRQWWLAPNGSGGYIAVEDGIGGVREGPDAASVLEAVLGDNARLFMGDAR
jgi:hypothetical protein